MILNAFYFEKHHSFLVYFKDYTIFVGRRNYSMSLKRIYNLYQTMEQEKIILSFNGVVTADVLTAVLDIMETKMTQLDESSKTKKKVFNVLVECLQNLYHHIDERIFDMNELRRHKSALVMVVRNEKSFLIQTGNYIDNALVKDLDAKLQKINSLDREHLREYYREVLGNGFITEKGTAGLGMIDIARKSGNKLEYEFLEIDKYFSFFSLNVKID